MNSIKCSKCGLSNFAGEQHCRRCSALLHHPTHVRRQKRPRRFSVVSLSLYAALVFGGYHLYEGAQRSIEEESAKGAYRVGTQATQKPQRASFSRAEQDRQRASQFGNTLKDNPSFRAKRKQEEETQKAMRQASGGQ